ALYPTGGRCVPLPRYPWQKQRYWLDAAKAVRGHQGRVDSGHPLLGMHISVAGAGAGLRPKGGARGGPSPPAPHVYGSLVVPAAAVLELMHAAGAALLGPGRLRVLGLILQAPLILPEKGARRVQVVLAEATVEGTPVSVYSQDASAEPGEAWTLH